MINKIFNKLITLIQSILIVIYIVFEELVWEKFAQPLFRYVKHLRLFLRLEIILNSTNRYIILFLFLLPFVIGELLGIVSAIIAVKGLVVAAIALYIFKLLIVTFAFWLFNTQKEKLLSFKIINYSYQKIIQFASWIKTTTVFISVKEKIVAIKELARKMIIKIRMKF